MLRRWLTAISIATATAFALGCGGSSTQRTTADAEAGGGLDAAGDGLTRPEAAAGDDAMGADSSIAESGATRDAAGADADASVDVAIGDGGPAPCGDASCSGGQLCAYQTGGPVVCTELDDAGGCTSALSYMQSCPSLGNRPGCYGNTPRPVRCVDVPSSCGATPSCSCLTDDPCPSICIESLCSQIEGRSLLCGCQ